MNRVQRITFGVIALALLFAGIYGTVAAVDPTWPGLVIRTGMIMGAIWFAAPSFSNVSRRLLIGSGIVAAVVVIRPTLILWGLITGLVAALLAGRSKH